MPSSPRPTCCATRLACGTSTSASLRLLQLFPVACRAESIPLAHSKSTGAVVGQQPFGGARASGTNDKAGSSMVFYRFLNVRTIKETFVPPTDYVSPCALFKHRS